MTFQKILSVMLIFLTFFTVQLFAEWDVSPSQSNYQYGPGESFTVEINLGGNGTLIDALGFDFHFPSSLLQFDGAEFTGTLLEPWMYKQVNETSAGNLRVAGFTISGQINSTGILLKLNFTVKANASGQGQFTIDGFTDDLSGASTTPATVEISTTPPGNWDLSPSETLYEYSPGQSFTVELMLSGSGSAIDAFGFDFTFPSDLLQFEGVDFVGTLIESWLYKDANENTPGTVRVAGFTTTGAISPNISGIFVKFSFTVKQGVSGSGQFSIINLADDLSGATTTPATIRIIEGQTVSICAPDTNGVPGQQILLPITIREDVTGMGILAFKFELLMDTSVVQPTGIEKNGTITSNWQNVASNLTDSSIIVAGFNASELTGSGTLIFIVCQISPTAIEGDTSNLIFNSAVFNEGNPMSNVCNGKLRVTNINISGNINYYTQNKPVDNATVKLDGYQAISANNGDYEISNVLPGTYVLKVEKEGDNTSGISPFDAAKVLQYSVGLISLSPMQLIAADVTGNGSVSPFDASYILQFSVNLIEQFPIGKDWIFIPDEVPVTESSWTDVPDSLVFDPLDTDMPDQDFTGIAYGDVTGNWQLNKASAATLAEISVDEAEENKLITTKLILNLEGEAYSGKMELSYDNSALAFSSVKSQDENIIVAAGEENGRLNLGFASAQNLDGKKLQFILQFKKQTKQATSSDLSVIKLFLDDKLANTRLWSQNESAQTAIYRLHQNYPNPFNPETEIAYEIAQPGKVVLEIYNALGQKIKTLVTSEQASGMHKVIWDGSDENGEKVTSGIYFYSIKAGDFRAMRKMILMR